MLEKLAIYLVLLTTTCTMSQGVSNSCMTSCVRYPRNVPCVPLRNDYVNVPGIGAYKSHKVAADWNTARKICQDEGGNLAVPNSVAEAKAIAKVYADTGDAKDATDLSQALIGFHDQFKEGEHTTIFDQSLSKAGFDMFSDNGPDNLFGAENCGAITKFGLLNDISCTNKNTFICELALCDYLSP